tara:strand:+ start:295 stop:774 length:480 start_codon:yes stop_codon:yes gene_type:complete
MSHIDILINNFNESAKSIQRYIIIACTISLTLFLLATIKDLKKISVLNLEVDAIPGLTIFLLLYIATGIMIAFQVHRLHDNLHNIDDDLIKKSLSLNPTVACGSTTIRIIALSLPVALFGMAMDEAYNHALKVVFMVSLFSIPYFIAAWHSINQEQYSH